MKARYFGLNGGRISSFDILRGAARAAWFGLLLAALVCAGGCASTKARQWVPERHNMPVELSLLYPGDAVELTFIGAPELNTVQTIRRDGKLSLRLIGEIEAAGKAPDVLQRELLELYKGKLLIEEAMVIVRSNPPVFAMGAVNSPTRIPIQQPIDVLEAIAHAGGFNESQARINNVIVIRHKDGKRYGYALDLRPSLYGDNATSFYLQPFDIVYVPRTRIVKINQWISQYINAMIPRLGSVGVNTSGDFYFGL